MVQSCLEKLTWGKVNTALAVLNAGLSDSGLGEEDVNKVSADIVHAGSLAAYIKQHESEEAELETKVNQLSTEYQGLETSITLLGAGHQYQFLSHCCVYLD